MPLPKLPLPALPVLPIPLSPSLARTSLIAARAGVSGLWFAPGPLGKFGGLNGPKQAPVPVLVRMFAVREAALAALLATAAPSQRGLHLKIGVGLDAADLAAGILAIRDKDSSLKGALITVFGAATAVVLGLAALNGEKG